jgi:hypothetical protein
MPYKRKGKCVYLKSTNRKVGCSKSIEMAKRYLKKLHMVENFEFPTFGQFFVLSESQVFDFDFFKSGVENFITWVKQHPNEKVPEHFSSLFYDIITNQKNDRDAHTRAGFTQDVYDKWLQFFSPPVFSCTASWAQRNHSYEKENKPHPVTYNYYITLNKTAENAVKFVKGLGKLDEKIKNFAQSKETTIQYKTHRLLYNFLSFNDSLKFFFYDRQLGEEIKKIVEEWLNESGVEKAERTHEFGFDRPNKSYGEILSEKISETFALRISQFPDMSVDYWVEYIKRELPALIRGVIIKDK